MINYGNSSKPVGIQDIVKPTKIPPKPVAKVVEIKQKTKFSLKPLFKLSIFIKLKTKLANPTRKTKIIVGIIFIIAIIVGAKYMSPISQPTKNPGDDNQTTTKKPGLVSGTPKYSVLLPAGKTIADYGGWTRPDPDKQVFIYTDKINGVSISVSQQPLPDDFKTDTADHIEQLAQDSNAGKKITVGSTIVYIGASSKGPQSLIFAKNDLLILIKSDDKVQDDQWTQYINTLQ